MQKSPSLELQGPAEDGIAIEGASKKRPKAAAIPYLIVHCQQLSTLVQDLTLAEFEKARRYNVR